MYELYDPCTIMFFYRCVAVLLLNEGNGLTLEDSNKHIMIDLGTGNNNKMCVVLPPSTTLHRLTRPSSNWAMDNKQEVSYPRPVLYASLISRTQMIDIIETVYRGASKGRGLVVSPKGSSSYSMLFRPA